MITPIHIIFDLLIYFLLIKTGLFEFEIIALVLLLSASLIDLDHLFSRQIYHPKRNPFKTHFLHKNYKFFLIISAIILFIYPLTFLGIGIINHFILDYFYNCLFFNAF